MRKLDQRIHGPRKLFDSRILRPLKVDNLKRDILRCNLKFERVVILHHVTDQVIMTDEYFFLFACSRLQ